jgi:predicted DNA repair protein MutK
LLLGATYLGFEGAEALLGWFTGHSEQPEDEAIAPQTPDEILAEEQGKIRSAVRTDFILSIEIVVIALGTVTGQPLAQQIIAVSLVALLATVGVYGIVTLLVRLDDIGLGIIRRSREGSLMTRFGRLLVAALPRIVKLLSIVGVIAMLLVGGGIYLHNIETIHHLFGHWPLLSGELVVGLAVGFAVLAVERTAHLLFFKD